MLRLKRKDEETGLHYNRYRYYEPHSGRYLSNDPIGLLGGLKNLAYVSDPNRWVNPLGLAKMYKHKYSNEYSDTKKGPDYHNWVAYNREAKLFEQENTKRQAEKIS